MPPRATTDVLLRLRQAEERDATRALERARREVERVTEARDQALAAQSQLRDKLGRHAERSGSVTVGSLVTRDAYRGELRAQRAAADQRVQAGERALRAALNELTAAQKRVEQALRAREAAQRQRAAEDKALARRRERRDQAATDDRWRPTRR